MIGAVTILGRLGNPLPQCPLRNGGKSSGCIEKMANEGWGLGLAAVDPEFLRRLARRCHRLVLLTRTEAAREHLRILASKFDEQADLIEKQQQLAEPPAR